MCVQCLLRKETHTDTFVLEMVFVVVIVTIMIGIIAEKEFEACLLVREEKSDLLPQHIVSLHLSFSTSSRHSSIFNRDGFKLQKEICIMTEWFDTSHLKKYILALTMIRLQATFH